MATVLGQGSRVCIEGVRRLTWDTGEMCEFAAALVAALECAGAGVSYPEVMAACGAAFRFTLAPQVNPGNYSIRNIVPDPHEPVRRAFRAVGFGYRFVPRTPEGIDPAPLMESVRGGVPVLASGVVGPSDISLITGYDHDGTVLMGWSTYQDIPFDHTESPDSSGYFRKTGWEQNTDGYIVIGTPSDRPAARDRLHEALAWAVTLARHPEVDGWRRGLDAYDAYVTRLEDASLYPEDDMKALGDRYLGLLCNLMMVDDRRAAAEYLRASAATIPDLAPHLGLAAACYEETGALRATLPTLIPEDFSEAATRRLADPTVRREAARVIRAIRAADNRALHHIEAALARLPDRTVTGTNGTHSGEARRPDQPHVDTQR